MIRADIQTVPGGNESRVDTLHILEIVNDCTGDEEHGNYDVRLLDGLFETPQQPWNVARVENYDRSRGAAKLVSEALKAVLTHPDDRWSTETISEPGAAIEVKRVIPSANFTRRQGENLKGHVDVI